MIAKPVRSVREVTYPEMVDYYREQSNPAKQERIWAQIGVLQEAH